MVMAISLSFQVQAEKRVLFMWLDPNRRICRNESLATGDFARCNLSPRVQPTLPTLKAALDTTRALHPPCPSPSLPPSALSFFPQQLQLHSHARTTPCGSTSHRIYLPASGSHGLWSHQPAWVVSRPAACTPQPLLIWDLKSSPDFMKTFTFIIK